MICNGVFVMRISVVVLMLVGGSIKALFCACTPGIPPLSHKLELSLVKSHAEGGPPQLL